MNSPENQASMTFSIITPSYNQLDWLRRCVASVRDQVGEKAAGTENSQSSGLQAGIPALAVEHIIQDAGTPGIEDFAREIGADFYRDGELIFEGRESKDESRGTRSTVGEAGESGDNVSTLDSRPYRIAIYRESDSGMYNAINRGLARASGELCAYLNCDEQYLPDALPAMASWFQDHPARAVCFADALVVDPQNNLIAYRRSVIPQRLHTMVSGNLAVLTCSTFFRRSVVAERRLTFPDNYRVIGDAVWILELLEAEIPMGLFPLATSAFVDTGENLALSSIGRAEGDRLAMQAPRLARSFRAAIVWHYRFRKYLAGAYRKRSISHQLYDSDTNLRRKYSTDDGGGIWTGRTES